MGHNSIIEGPPEAQPSPLRVPTARSAGLATLAAAMPQGDADDGQWLELTERFRFTLAGLFIGAVSFRCLTLQRALDQPPYPISPSLFSLL